jgi:hypothetical protein
MANGSPGAIPMWAMACEAFPHPDMTDRLLELAKKVGDLTWEQGIVTKGNGLSYGITGNGYAMHALSRFYES